MTDRPTREDHAAALEHDPRTCHICCNPHHGDQAPDPLELENDRLRAEVERLKGRLDHVNSCFQDEISDFNDYRDEAKQQVATLTARLENAEAGSVVAKEYIARLVAERDASREELGRMNDGWGKHAGRAMDAAVADEREACARWVETFRAGMRFNDGKDASAAALREIAAAIRARGVKP